MAEEKEKKGRMRRAFGTVGDVLLVLVAVLALFVLVVSISAKKDEDNTATVFGYQMRFVVSDSMATCDKTDVSSYDIGSIPVKSCVFVEVKPDGEGDLAAWYADLRVGDVLTFKYLYTKQETITHRVVAIAEKETGGYIITLEGDNKNSEDGVLRQVIDTSQTDSPNYVIGKVRGQSYLLGLLVYAFRAPLGVIFLVIVPCLIMIAFQVMRICRVMSAEKKEKEAAERDAKEAEIEELKRKLSALEGKAEQEPPQ